MRQANFVASPIEPETYPNGLARLRGETYGSYKGNPSEVVILPVPVTHFCSSWIVSGPPPTSNFLVTGSNPEPAGESAKIVENVGVVNCGIFTFATPLASVKPQAEKFSPISLCPAISG